jgi:uncharacterized protein (TIGR03083 family)
MTLTRAEVVTGTTQELGAFEELIRSIDTAGWAAPSRCAGWSVGDICRHVTGTISSIAGARFDEIVGPDHTARQVAERQDLDPAALADELHAAAKIVGDLAAAFDDAAWAAPPPLDIPGTLGRAVEAIWYDLYVHGLDVRAALGRPEERGPGLRVAVTHIADVLTDEGWGPATLALDGVEEMPVSGGGEKITGDALQFVLAATGRIDPSSIGLDPTVNIYA